MSANAMLGHGSAFQEGNGAIPETFIAFAEVTNISPPELSVDSVETTHLTSPGRAREFMPGLQDPGEVSIDFNYRPGGSVEDAIRAKIAAGTLANYRIVFPNGAYFQFYGFPTSFTPGETSNDDKLTASASYKLSGHSAGIVDV